MAGLITNNLKLFKQTSLREEVFMINQAVSVLMSLVMSVSMAGCSTDLLEKDDNTNNSEEVVSQIQTNFSENEIILEDNTMEKIQIIINGETFTATMENNETANNFISMLSISLDMQDLNGSEKYNYLSNSLPTDTFIPNKINAGDLMLYGSDCIVLFYDDFSTSYRYTSLGKIDNPKGLKDVVGNENIEITFKVE